MSLKKEISEEINRRKEQRLREQKKDEKEEKQKQLDLERRLKLMGLYLKTSNAENLLTQVNQQYLDGKGELIKTAEIQTYEVTDYDDWSKRTYEVTKPVVGIRLSWIAQQGAEEKECFIGVSVNCEPSRFDGKPHYMSINVYNDLPVSADENNSIHDYETKMKWKSLAIIRLVRKSIARRVVDHIEAGLI